MIPLPSGAPPRGLGVQLRPYQQRAVEQIRARIASGTRRLVIVAPTGSGKTTIAAYIISAAAASGRRVLFLAHRRELISQAYGRLVQLGVPETQVGVLMGSDARRRLGAPIQVASVPTLIGRAKPRAELIFIDECHRATAKSYRELSGCYPDAVHLGLTATPFRANGDGLGDVYDDLLVVASPAELIAAGHLVAPRVFTVAPSDRPDLSGVRQRRGDYDQRALADVVDRRALVGNIVEHWLKLAKGVRTVAFAVSVAHSQRIAQQFREAGIAAEHLDGDTPVEERDAILARLESGQTRLVSNCLTLCEGWDMPSVKCAILARPTRSAGLYLQQAGRILRPWNGQQAIIIDHGGCALEHGLPQDGRAFSLAPRRRRRGPASTPQLRTCTACYAVLPLMTRVCPHCDEVLSERPAVPTQRDGKLVEISGEELRRIELKRLREIAAARGYKRGWIYHRFKEKFGEAPPAQAGDVRAQPTGDARALRAALRSAARGGTELSWAAACAAMDGESRG